MDYFKKGYFIRDILLLIVAVTFSPFRLIGLSLHGISVLIYRVSTFFCVYRSPVSGII